MISTSRLGRLISRNIFSTLRASSRHYDPEVGGAEMKSTTVTMLNKEDEEYLYVEAYSPIGFRLNNGFQIIGPCVLFPRSILHWAIADIHELSEESLSLFPLLEPKPDILVLGIGDHKTKYDKNIMKYLRKNRINVEILPTDQACATFNFLNSERRIVAAALIPPTYTHTEYDEDLVVRAQLQNDSLFQLKHGFTENPLANTPGEWAPLLDSLQKNIYPKFGIPVKAHKKGDQKAETGQSEASDSKAEPKER